MSEQADKANEFARKNFGTEVDAAAGAMGLRVLGEGDGGTGDPKGRPWVELPGRGQRDLSDFAQELGAIMADAPLFRRENVLVTVDHETGLLQVMDPERFLSWVSDYANVFESVDVGRGANRQTMRFRRTMPLTTARGTLRSDRFYYQVRPLARVNAVRMPTMRGDGRVELLPEGYDEESGIYTMPSGIPFDEGMTLEKAVALLNDYYSEFTWADYDNASGRSRSKAVAITAAVALFGMGMQSVESARMGFMFRANTQGGGKSLLAQMAITPSYGLPKNTPRANEDELRKILDMAALQGAAYLFFDNLKNHLDSALLEGYMTTPVWSGRVMGTQRGFEAKKSTVLIVTGNNLSVSADLQRRMLQCDLFIENFDLQEREHRRELNPVVLARPDVRGEFLSALWALIRHWDKAGRPKAGRPEKPYRIASFAEWSEIFGGIVQAAGFGNPLEKPADEQQADKQTVHQRTLVELLGHDVQPGNERKEYTFQEVIECCVENELFTWKIEGRMRSGKDGQDERFEVTSKCASTMGRMFTDEMAGKRGRVFALPDGRRVRFGKDGEGRGRRYWVELVAAAPAS